MSVAAGTAAVRSLNSSSSFGTTLNTGPARAVERDVLVARGCAGLP